MHKHILVRVYIKKKHKVCVYDKLVYFVVCKQIYVHAYEDLYDTMYIVFFFSITLSDLFENYKYNFYE